MSVLAVVQSGSAAATAAAADDDDDWWCFCNEMIIESSVDECTGRAKKSNP